MTQPPTDPENSEKTAVLEVDRLCIAFQTDSTPVTVIDDVSFSVERGEILGLLGESGSGKSLTALSILGLLPGRKCQIARGNILFRGRDLAKLSQKDLRKVRGNSIAMIFQEPTSSLNPTLTIGNQLIEAIQTHRPISRRKAKELAIDLLNRVGVTMLTIA